MLHQILAPFLKGTEQENLLENILVGMIKDSERRHKKRGASYASEETQEAATTADLLVDYERERRILQPVSNLDQVIEAINEARATKTVLRVAGSLHSPWESIFTKNKYGKILLLIDDLRKIDNIKEVEENGEKYLYCRVGAGCNLGRNPRDPEHSTWENSVCYEVSQLGYGFPELGGIIHQTVGGYIMTGSAGGSLQHGFADVIQEIEFVDGTGKCRKAMPFTDMWCAVGVSMGLLGIITHVTFRLPKVNPIKGKETGYHFADSSLGPDEKGKSRLRESLEKHEYFRVNWFPQKEARLVQEWVGKQSAEGEIIPYDSVLSKTFVAILAAIVLSICDSILQKKDPTENEYKIIGILLKQFVSLKPKVFRDVFYATLPMDNFAHVDSFIRVHFTEIWMPVEQCQTVMDKLNVLFQDQKVAGNFATEIYGAKKSPFWLSMSHGGSMVRVDAYWWAYNRGNMREYFSHFWDALLDIPTTRLHWGKYLPLPNQKCGNQTFNLAYLKSVYPKMDDWLNWRENLDPDQVFVTEYWRNILEIPNVTGSLCTRF